MMLGGGLRTMQHSCLPGHSTPVCCQPRSRAFSSLVSCSAGSSSSSNSIKAGVRKPTKQNSQQAHSVSTSATTSTVTVTTATEEDTARTQDITLVNPPLGFSNNIVSARPLVVTPPQHDSEVGLVDSSDEELDQSPAAASDEGVTPAGGSAGRSSAWRCLVLDSRYLPVNVIPWGRAVVMDLSGKVDVLEYHPGGFAYSAYKQHPLPAVLRVRTFVDVHEFAGRLSLTRKNIMMRDHHRCQYCGSSKELTLDHVTPVCRGGMNSWQNLVTACMTCNQRKGDKSLQQLGWKLPLPPREPTPQEVGVVAGISKADLQQPPLPWVPYLASFKSALEKAQRRAAHSSKAAKEAISGSNSSTSVGALLAEGHQLLAKAASSTVGAPAVKKAPNGKSPAPPKRMRH